MSIGPRPSTIAPTTPYPAYQGSTQRRRPDGAAVDAEGNYWVAMFEGGRIVCLSPTGELLREVRLPVRCPTSVCFGGPDLRTLYVTSASHGRSNEELAQYPHTGKVLAFDVGVAGLEQPEYKS